jgi:hypothetical protein
MAAILLSLEQLVKQAADFPGENNGAHYVDGIASDVIAVGQLSRKGTRPWEKASARNHGSLPRAT